MMRQRVGRNRRTGASGRTVKLCLLVNDLGMHSNVFDEALRIG